MSLIGEKPAPIPAGGKSEHIKDGTDASFMADVIEAVRRIRAWCASPSHG